jgi:hypothetical protein
MGEYYWCLRHATVEQDATACPAQDRLGPYATAEAAREWRDTHDGREEAWKAEDERWNDDEDDDEPGG